MTVDACAKLVARGDPDRFAAVMAAPVALRARLFVLYAFNLEVARAPWVTREPLIAEMRLQWWRDVVAEPVPRAHEVAGPLFDLIRDAALPVDVLDRLIAARRWDVYAEPFVDATAFEAYLEDTAAGLMWLAAKACGADAAVESVVRSYGWAHGLANYLRAVPDLTARGRVPLLDNSAEKITALAQAGLRRIAVARAGQSLIGQAAPALLAGWQAEKLLRQAAVDPLAVPNGTLGQSEFNRRRGLLWQALMGRL